MCQECVRVGGVRARLVQAYVAEFPETEEGGGHIVFADYNIDDSHINYCLTQTAVPLSVRDRAFLSFLHVVER